MKKSYLAVILIVVLALSAGFAFADEPEQAPDTPAQNEQAKGPKKIDIEAIAKFKKDTLEQRTKLAGAKAAMGALMKQESPDPEKARSLAEEIFGLREQLMAKALESKLPPFVVEDGPGFGHGHKGPDFGPMGKGPKGPGMGQCGPRGEGPKGPGMGQQGGPQGMGPQCGPQGMGPQGPHMGQCGPQCGPQKSMGPQCGPQGMGPKGPGMGQFGPQCGSQRPMGPQCGPQGMGPGFGPKPMGPGCQG